MRPSSKNSVMRGIAALAFFAIFFLSRENGIEVTAIHNHMLDDQLRLFFMHFWANDDSQNLARGFAAAVGKVAIASR